MFFYDFSICNILQDLKALASKRARQDSDRGGSQDSDSLSESSEGSDMEVIFIRLTSFCD